MGAMDVRPDEAIDNGPVALRRYREDVIKKAAKTRDIEAKLAEYERELRAQPAAVERESELQLV